MKRIIYIMLMLAFALTAKSQTINNTGGARIVLRNLGIGVDDTALRIPVRALNPPTYWNYGIPEFGLLQINPIDTNLYFQHSIYDWRRLLTTSDTSAFGHIQAITATLPVIATGSPTVNISLQNQGVSGTYGNSTHIPVLTYDTYGVLTGVTTASITPTTVPTVTITGIGANTVTSAYPDFTVAASIPTLTAGANISVNNQFPNYTITGTYAAPTPTITGTGATTVSAVGLSYTVATNAIQNIVAGTGMSVTTVGSTATVTNTSPSSGGTVTSITAGAGLTGGTITGSGTVAMASQTVAGTYGSSSIIPSPTFNAQGVCTAVAVYTMAATTTYSVSSGRGVNVTASGSSTFTPTIDTTISLTWLTGQVVSISSLSATVPSGIKLVNPATTTSVSVTSASPPLQLEGRTYNGGTDQPIDFQITSSASSFIEQIWVNGGAKTTVRTIAVTGATIFNNSNGVTFSGPIGGVSENLSGVLNLNTTGTTVSNSGSGTTVFNQALRGSAKKEVIIYCNAATGTASYTYPTAFTNTPAIITAYTGLAGSVITSISTTAVTVTGAASTGYIFLEGY